MCWRAAQVALLAFLTMGLLLVAGFLAGQLWLVARGTTTYETYKWREVQRRLAVEHLAEIDGGASGDGALDVRRYGAWWLAWWHGEGSRRLPAVVLPKNVYNRGLRANFADAIFLPAWARRKQGAPAKKKR
jgi:hypothetical protein